MGISNFISAFNFWGMAKVFVLVGLAVYVVFAGVMIKQVKLMRETINLGLDRWVITVAWGHFFLAVTIFLVALIFL